jgi:hypothetical protein
MNGATAAIERTQIAELFDPPTDQRELVRHYTLRSRPRRGPALPW